MSFVKVLVTEDQLMGLFRELVRSNSFQIVGKDELPEFKDTLGTYEVKEVSDRFDALIERTEKILALLGVESKFSGEEPVIDPPGVLREAEEKLAEIEAEVFPIVERIKTLEAQIDELDISSEKLIAIEKEGISLEKLKNLRFLWLTYGFIAGQNFPQLREGLARIPHLLISREIPYRRIVYTYIIVPLSSRLTLERTLKNLPFTKDTFLEKITGPGKETVERIETVLWEAREERVLLLSELKALRRRYESLLLRLKRQLSVNNFVIQTLGKAGRVGRVFMLSGWVPANSLKRIRKIVELYDKSVLSVSPPISPSEVEDAPLVPPTKFEHPGFLKPFEWLVTTYGYPSYCGLDPTFLVMLSFLTMFGIMFADVGHGAALVLLGLLLSRLKVIKNLGITATWCGGSATLFGFLFGSVFGKEEIIPALWFRPVNDPMSFMKMAVIFGIGILSLGLILNTIQGVRRKDWGEALFGRHGVAGLALYWAVIVVGIYLMKGGVFSLKIKALITVALLIPVILIMLGSLLYSPRKRKAPEGGFMESAFGIVELGLSILTNTLSFIRVAAFNISHAGLCLAVYSIAEQMKQFAPASGANLIGVVVTAVLGHLLILGLEGLVVAIQCLRLEYYEFFSKFFSEQGVKFEPLKI